MGLFGRRIDIKNASKTTYSEEDLNKLVMMFRNEFSMRLEKQIYTPFRRELPKAWDAQMRDMAFEKILDDRLFTFKHLLVIPNPYGMSVQTAMLLFNTSKECRVRYRVLGKTEGNDFVGETGAGTRHRVPILGLYKGYTNKLKLELIDEKGEVFQRRDLTIYTRDIPLRLQNIVTKVERQTPTRFPFVLVNGVHFNPIVLDQDGEVRYSLQMKTDTMGMIPLQNGHFLYSDASQNRVADDGESSVPCQYHELDYMGRIYQSYLIEHPLASAAALHGDSLFLVTASDANHLGDCILELDRNTGLEKKRLPLVDLLGEKYRNQKTWAPVSTIEFFEKYFLIAIKRFHSVIALDWVTSEIDWVLGPRSIWEGTALEQKLLARTGGGDVEGQMLEMMAIERNKNGKLCIRAYYIQNKGTVPVRDSVASEDSRIIFYIVDEKAKCFTVEKDMDVVKSKRFGSAIFDEESGRTLSLSGCLERKSEDLRACIEELDEDGEVLNRLRLCKVFRRAWLFEPNIESYSVALKKRPNVVFGQLTPPAEYHGDIPVPCEEKLKKKIFGNIRVSGNLFLYAFYPSTVQKVYLVGKEHCYLQDYTGLRLKRRRESFSIALDRLEYDEYYVYVEYDGEVYKLKNEIRIEPLEAENT